MSNRLEQEFPEVTWQVVPPLGPDGLRPEVIREHLERGRQLHSRAIRNSARGAGAAVVHALRAAIAFARCASHGLAKRPPERDRWAGSAHGA